MPKPRPTTISRDPYAEDPYAFIGAPARKEDKARPADSPAEPTPGGEAARRGETEKITSIYPAELIERARDAAYWERATLSGIIARALSDALDRMEAERGKPYPPREDDLRVGRPVRTGKTRKA